MCVWACVFKEELLTVRRQLEGRDGELKRLQDETGSRSPTPAGSESTERGECLKGTINQLITCPSMLGETTSGSSCDASVWCYCANIYSLVKHTRGYYRMHFNILHSSCFMWYYITAACLFPFNNGQCFDRSSNERYCISLLCLIQSTIQRKLLKRGSNRNVREVYFMHLFMPIYCFSCSSFTACMYVLIMLAFLWTEGGVSLSQSIQSVTGI